MVAEAVVTEAQEYVTQTIGVRAGRVEWLRADTLRPWRLQRRLYKSMVRKIAREFDPDILELLTITRRDGVDYVLDGQHRWVAIVQEMGWGDQNVPCYVLEGLTDAQENKLFHAQGPGMRRQLSALHDFYVLYEGGDAVARKVVGTVHRSGLHMSWSGSSVDNGVQAVVALKNVARVYGIYRLQLVLTFLRDALGPVAQAYTGELIQGFTQFHIRYEDTYERGPFVAKIHALGVEGVQREAMNMRAALGVSQYAALGRACHKVYNLNRRTTTLPPWVENFRLEDSESQRLERMRETRWPQRATEE